MQLASDNTGQACRSKLQQDILVQRYTGQHWRVEPEALAEADHVAKYALGAYGFDAEMLLRRSWPDFFRSWLRWTSSDMLDVRSVPGKAQTHARASDFAPGQCPTYCTRSRSQLGSANSAASYCETAHVRMRMLPLQRGFSLPGCPADPAT